jgi:nicotinate-nucleotide adenylyltransferase
MMVGVFSGSFNPVHNGHLSLAAYLLQQRCVEEVWWIRTPQNPWKPKASLLSDEHRAEMLRLAIVGLPGMRLCNIEDRLPQPSYTVDTLAALHAQYPQHRFCLVIGADNWALFDGWRQWERILAMCDLAVYPRPGYPLDHPAWFEAWAGRAAAEAHIHLLPDAPTFDISATEIRTALNDADTRTAQTWLPASVLDYIRAHHLYTDPKNPT